MKGFMATVLATMAFVRSTAQSLPQCPSSWTWNYDYSNILPCTVPAYAGNFQLTINVPPLPFTLPPNFLFETIIPTYIAQVTTPAPMDVAVCIGDANGNNLDCYAPCSGEVQEGTPIKCQLGIGFTDFPTGNASTVVLQYTKGNWNPFETSHLNLDIMSTCWNGNAVDESLCTGNAVSYWANTTTGAYQWALGGCTANPTRCRSMNAICCPGTGYPSPNVTLCGPNCFDCNNQC